MHFEFISPKRESGSEGKKHVIDHEHWEEFADFVHQPIPLSESLASAAFSLFSLLFWVFVALGILNTTAKTATAL